MKHPWHPTPSIAAIVCAALSAPAFADDRIVALLMEKAQTQSEVMNDAFFLSDVYGPRWLASPSVQQAAEWVHKRLDQIGMSNARLEGVGPVGEGEFRWSGQGWSYKRFSLNLLEPQYANLTAIPVPNSQARTAS